MEKSTITITVKIPDAEAETVEQELCTKFRNRVNQTSFVNLKYENYDNKNKWNCICSCMDWLDVSVANYRDGYMHDSDWHKASMNLFNYISVIDLMWECIQQLHRVFFDNNKIIPFTGVDDIFHNKFFDVKDDNEFFKEIRACFGAHPVKLNTKDKNIKHFASWPTPLHTGTDFYNWSIFIYSSNLDDEHKHVGVNIADLQKFFDQRYSYLETIMNEIDKQEQEFIKEKKSKTIEASDDVREQIQILKAESYERCGHSGYKEILVQIEHFFNTDFTCSANNDKINNYRLKLLQGLDAIKQALQDMDFEKGFDINQVLNPKSQLPNPFTYDYNILYEKTFSNTWKPLNKANIIEPLKKHICFSYDSIKELYWLVVIAIILEQEDSI